MKYISLNLFVNWVSIYYHLFHSSPNPQTQAPSFCVFRLIKTHQWGYRVFTHGRVGNRTPYPMVAVCHCIHCAMEAPVCLEIISCLLFRGRNETCVFVTQYISGVSMVVSAWILFPSMQTLRPFDMMKLILDSICTNWSNSNFLDDTLLLWLYPTMRGRIIMYLS